MSSDGDSGLRDLEAQLASKEREWKELQAVRVYQLESSLRKAQEECSSLRERYQRLKEDFQFNLAILDERERELERYDSMTARALTVEHNRQEEWNKLRMQVTKLEEQRAREAEEWQEKLSVSQNSAAQHRLQLDELKRSMAAEIQKQTEEFGRIQQGLQCRIQQVEGELTLERQEMSATFDSDLRQQEHEFNMQMDEMRAVVLSHELKVKLLSKEIEMHRQAQLRTTEALKASQQFGQQTQTQLQHKEQEIKDLAAVKDNRIKELEDEVKLMETNLTKAEDDHIQKYEKVVQNLKECEAQLEAQHQAYTGQLQEAEKRIVGIQKNMEILAAQARCIQQDQQVAMQQKDESIQRLLTELGKTRTGWDEYISHVSSEMDVKDTMILTLQERESKLRKELDRNREEMERYKQQLSAGLKRERALEQMQVQNELEWEKRCEDMKAKHYLASEELIQDLTQARDEAKAELKEKEQELQDLTVLLHCVKNESNQTLQGLTPKPDSLVSEEMRRLQEQNSILRAVITQMRKDMEGLSHALSTPQAQPQVSSCLPHPRATATTSITPIGQMATGPPALPTDISSEVKPADGPFLQDHAITSASVVQKASEAHTEPEVTNIMQQPALVQQLQEENLYLGQQQASGLMSSGLFENVQTARSNSTLLHVRLKQAAACIALLSKEKQKLIEMGNRLRAQVISAGLQEPVEPEKDSTEKQGDQHDRLSTLEQLQYQLTTQELQYALRQRVCTVAEQLLPGTNIQDPSTKGGANPWSQGRKATDRPESSKNKDSTPSLSQSHSLIDVGPKPHLNLSWSQLSSEESLRSLKELWEILDHRLSPSVFSEGDGELCRREVAESDGAGVQMMVHGVSAPIYGQPSTEAQPRMTPSHTLLNTTKTSKPGALSRISKIRNYNVKD
ncbi:coiled-coil domain-containing protein 57 isoform X2 [Mastacembelus armatus]|nr:coiled-coil domain-containing protein 57 isoform X2 [Mastacembelus armatus]